MKNRILLSTGSLYNYGTDRVFEIARRTGFDGVEIIVDRRTDTFQVPYLRSLIERYGLPIGAVHSPFSFLKLAGWKDGEIPRARRSVRLAEELGAPVVVLHGPSFTDRPYLKWLQEELPSLQAATKVIVAVENMPHYRKPFGRIGARFHWPNIQDAKRKKAWNFVPSFLLPSCHLLSRPEDLLPFRHVVLDVTHLGTGGYDPARVYDLLGERVAHVHLSNFDGQEHRELRKGEVEIAGFLRHLTAKGYAGDIALEISPGSFASEDESATVETLAANLAIIHDNLGRS
jgi:sugar phosphate isomerase/epimerase